ncbi:nucleotidyltransferase family protein [Rubellimicrobium rubrum]|nr:nucleotidyltransferase family protein [Rubellimicrobium rubrum]
MAPAITTDEDGAADAVLARALCGPVACPPQVRPEVVVRRALYHGVAGCLTGTVEGWPSEAAEALRRAAMAQAMWEMRHRLVLSNLLSVMAASEVRVLVLKGSALAYDLYEPSAARARGDSDILIAPADRDTARRVLAAQGFAHFYDDPTGDEAVRLQETWTKQTPDGLVHDVDLHWQALNSPLLAHALQFDAVWARRHPLPRLCQAAFGLPRDGALLLACAHRAQHIVNPYYVDGQVHYSGDRLIWLRDIDLLARVIEPAEWQDFEAAAAKAGLARVALDGLAIAARQLGTPVPAGTVGRLSAAPQDTPETRYLLGSHQAGRALRDLRAVPGLGRKIGFLWGRLVPPASFMRAKYPDRSKEPLPVLHLRRIAAFLRPRPRGRGT